MKCRFSYCRPSQLSRAQTEQAPFSLAPGVAPGRGSERGIALVITLVMLAIVTVMAIVFLAVSRRERTAVKMAEDLTTATLMAEAALERAKAEAIARMAVAGSKLHYTLFNSTNFVAPYYDPALGASPLNVSYNDKDGNRLTGTDYLRMLANLQYDARPPVFVETNQNPNLPTDFRFYIDFNRNRRFETNGLVPEIGPNGRQVGTNMLDLVGDPEWIGILERPDQPHSETNRFVGRMAYLVLPAGKTLDLNFIHNHLESNADQIDLLDAPNGFTRNQGVGSWEINLAAFFRELNTNVLGWPPNTYRFRLSGGQLPTGFAFDDARAVLAYRYAGRRSHLRLASFELGPANIFNPNRFNDNLFDRDDVDNFGDGPYPLRGDLIMDRRLRWADLNNPDDEDRPWPGSTVTNAFTDLQQLFALNPAFTNRLSRPGFGQSTYDRYTFYRLAAQMGTDSTPALKGKLHLNYDNAVGQITNSVLIWTNALRFFTNAADLMLKASMDLVTNRTRVGNIWVTNVYYQIGDTYVRTNFSLNNIQVYRPPTPLNTNDTGNEYTATIHRILQLALNIYDNTRRMPNSPIDYPTVLQPIYTRTATNLYISGFRELTDAAIVGNGTALQWRDPREYFHSSTDLGPVTNVNFYGQHVIVGAKKGFPNLNELALQSYVEVSRKLEVVKDRPGGTLNATNQMFLVSLLNRWGMETWNSYTSTYPRQVSIAGDVRSTIVIRDLNTNQPVFFTQRLITSPPTNVTTWPGRKFELFFDQTFPVLVDQPYSQSRFQPTNTVRFTVLEPSPRFHIITTNDVRFWMIDTVANRIIDYVTFDDLVTVTDLSTNLYSTVSGANQQFGQGSFNENMFWDPTPVGTSGLTVGITNQIAVSSGDIVVSETTWRNYRFSSPNKDYGIAGFRAFMDLGLRPTDPPVQPFSSETRHQTPFVPTRRIQQIISWGANDPFVHYMPEDLTRLPNRDKPENMAISEPLKEWNIGRINDVYRPWGWPSENDPLAYNMGVKDPGIRKSDDWSFPINEVREGVTNLIFASIGELGRIHRGTPWQTVYLKSILQFGTTNQILVQVDPQTWKQWAGSAGGFPSSDWRLLDVFTTAVHENAARGLLSVNQTNAAAWSAVLSGVAVATNTVRTADLQGTNPDEGYPATNAFKAFIIDPGTPQISRIVESIHLARHNQVQVVTNWNRGANPRLEWMLVPKTNMFTGGPVTEFDYLGEILSAPALSVQSPFLNNHPLQVRRVWTDAAVEFLPQQILGLLQRDEPRFVVYAFGQSLKPAPRSLSTSADYYHLVTNYQITGEVITKTTFRVEGELRNPNDPLRAVIESYEILPPAE